MAKIGVFDLCSFFWTVAGTRKRGEDPYGLALQVLRYIRSCAEKVGVEDVIFGADGPSGRSFRRSVCPDYKAGREAKDPEHRAELDALTTALLDAGFTVHKAVASSGSSATGGEPEWFEGDDVVASFAVTILRDPESEVFVGSNDWDLAPLLAFPKVRLFTTKAEERTAADVKREFGVEPLMLPQLKALAGDSDGYKPFPGLEKGKPGIGDKTAAAILEKFGSAEAAVKAALEPDAVAAPNFGTLPHRVISLLRAGGEAALAMGLTCAKLRTDAPVPTDVDFGEWADVVKALLDRQKVQQNEPRPEAPKAIPTLEERVAAGERATVPADTKAFQEAAHEQLTGEATEKITARFEYGDGSTVPITIDVTPVCPRCLGVEPGKPAGDPEHPHPGPFTAEVCEACFLAAREPGERLSDSAPIAVTPLAIGRPIEAFRDNPVAAEDEERVVPRKRRSSKAAATVTIAQDFTSADPDKVAAAFKDDILKAAERRAARGAPGSCFLEPNESGPDFGRDANLAPLDSTEPKVFVLLTGSEFIALTPLPALAAAGLLTTPEAYAGNFSALLDALREGAFRPCDGVFIGSVPEACARGLSELSAVASCVMNGLEVLQSWRAFVDQLHVLPRFTDLAKYGGKLVRA